jgi:TldD protein
MLALDAAHSAGAQYADVRISRNRVQSISTRERRVQVSLTTSVRDRRSNACGSAWGFAVQRLTRDEVARIARRRRNKRRRIAPRS